MVVLWCVIFQVGQSSQQVGPTEIHAANGANKLTA